MTSRSVPKKYHKCVTKPTFGEVFTHNEITYVICEVANVFSIKDLGWIMSYEPSFGAPLLSLFLTACIIDRMRLLKLNLNPFVLLWALLAYNTYHQKYKISYLSNLFTVHSFRLKAPIINFSGFSQGLYAGMVIICICRIS